MNKRKVNCLIADTGAFIKNAPVHEFAEKIYTVARAVKEIRDKATRQRLQFLPYELNFREPSHEAIKYVTEFSKKTGDYPSLSAVDIQIIALTYELEKELVGTDHLNKEPAPQKITSYVTEAPTSFAGFYIPDENTDSKAESSDLGEDSDPIPTKNNCDGEGCDIEQKFFCTELANENVSKSFSAVSVKSHFLKEGNELCSDECNPIGPSCKETNINNADLEMMDVNSKESSKNYTETGKSGANETSDGELSLSLEQQEHCHDAKSHGDSDKFPIKSEQVDVSLSKSSGNAEYEGALKNDVLNEEIQNESRVTGCHDSDEEGDDSGGEEYWITPDNINKMKKKMNALNLDSIDAQINVSCITTDFAIQNVLLQMGLNIISVDGMLIKRTKVFILRCFACYSITNNMNKTFCPNCGNKCLKRVAVTVDKDGKRTVHINFKRPINIRGMKYSLPMPRGGKHSDNPILCEDQPIPHNRPSKAALKKVDALDPDYIALTSPFASNDLYSRAACLGIVGKKAGMNRSINPNVRRKNKRKK